MKRKRRYGPAKPAQILDVGGQIEVNLHAAARKFTLDQSCGLARFLV
jgi:hypothetical protein